MLKSYVIIFRCLFLADLCINLWTSMELSVMNIKLKPVYDLMRLQYMRWACWTNFRHLVIKAEMGLVVQQCEAAINLCFDGFLCIFGIHNKIGSCCCFSSMSIFTSFIFFVCCVIMSWELSDRSISRWLLIIK